MTRWYLFLVMLVFVKAVADYDVGSDYVPSGRNYYDTLVHPSAPGSEVRYNRQEGRQKKSSKKKERFSVFKGDQSYYQSIIDEAAEKRWSFPVVLSYSLEYQVFDNC